MRISFFNLIPIIWLFWKQQKMVTGTILYESEKKEIPTFYAEGRLEKGKRVLCTQIQCVNKLLKASRVLLSMHKPFELVFLICLGWQPFVQAEYDMRAYHHNTDCSLMSTLPLHTKNPTLALFAHYSTLPLTGKLQHGNNTVCWAVVQWVSSDVQDGVKICCYQDTLPLVYLSSML